jgi:hypothetical protein
MKKDYWTIYFVSLTGTTAGLAHGRTHIFWDVYLMTRFSVNSSIGFPHCKKPRTGAWRLALLAQGSPASGNTWKIAIKPFVGTSHGQA